MTTHIPSYVFPVYDSKSTAVGVIERNPSVMASWPGAYEARSPHRTGVQAHRSKYDAARWLFQQHVMFTVTDFTDTVVDDELHLYWNRINK